MGTPGLAPVHAVSDGGVGIWATPGAGDGDGDATAGTGEDTGGTEEASGATDCVADTVALVCSPEFLF